MKNALTDDMGLMYISEHVSGEKFINNIDVCNNNNLFYVTFDTNLQSFDVINRNQRMYKADNISRAFRSARRGCPAR